MPNTALSLRGRMTYCAHMFKALTRQHHKELLPFLEKHIPKDGIVIDVGAHAGQFTKLFSHLAPQGHVYSFEPGGYAHSIASAVVRLRRLKNASLFRMGLGDTPSEQTLSVPIKRSGSMGFGLSHIGTPDRKSRQEKIEITTLDHFAATHNLQRIDFIKADIEGWEMRFLLGARQSIEKFRPAITLEVNDAFLRRAGNNAAEVWTFLQERGYRIFKLKSVVKGEPQLLSEPVDCDIWCVPS